MKKLLMAMATSTTLLFSTLSFAEPEYVRIEMEIDVAKPAADVWAKVGDYCGISEWLNLDCVITAGDGKIGTVRGWFAQVTV